MIFRPNKPKNGGITAGFNRAGAGSKLAELGNGADSSQEVRQTLFLVYYPSLALVHQLSSLASSLLVFASFF
jgi:hypothetical protein